MVDSEINDFCMDRLFNYLPFVNLKFLNFRSFLVHLLISHISSVVLHLNPSFTWFFGFYSDPIGVTSGKNDRIRSEVT